jgi:hypothetical protein
MRGVCSRSQAGPIEGDLSRQGLRAIALGLAFCASRSEERFISSSSSSLTPPSLKPLKDRPSRFLSEERTQDDQACLPSIFPAYLSCLSCLVSSSACLCCTALHCTALLSCSPAAVPVSPKSKHPTTALALCLVGPSLAKLRALKLFPMRIRAAVPLERRFKADGQGWAHCERKKNSRAWPRGPAGWGVPSAKEGSAAVSFRSACHRGPHALGLDRPGL